MIALTIAGSDSGGGAGIQADLKTMSALGVYGASVITAITAQNTRGVTAVHGIPADIVTAQLDAVLSDLDVKAIKIGMVGDRAVISAIARALAGSRIPIVLDPVMIATSGDRLIGEGAEKALFSELLPLATLVTPNVPEAGVLLNAKSAVDVPQMREQARELAALGPAILLKGGHLTTGDATDVFFHEGRPELLSAARIASPNTHGTGCTLSSAVTAFLARGMALRAAVHAAKEYISAAIAASDQLQIGSGHGPVHHFHAVWPR
ncbi:bifunctional hydroxymethylpyrimidine kinase/phosphomethylpyrimidine kinase [Acuticoccus sp. MNP-M23]|uniref:bifunctional hydroxymethylpyrimidine kinase/phosphomethylpyrimidine kinase n=1 Tax=Acuticoccus sp. MNP-M23 TaxID=3072793 RepID=UPI00281622C6|nr:bifunctional hydroxymethylpyrimidine kinase/phosphomethylpyrimidine kinase [Acuticoccus sp. MNP-M23]WMS42065.1 bifunctional hydroxymethylpyrimidine kinase/phosphomethylpyrimidine kinase [Acuticoccus sp. MNP-M23]